VVAVAAPVVGGTTVIAIGGEVDCDGYAVTVDANVNDDHRLVIEINAVAVFDQVIGGEDATHTFGPFTGDDTTLSVRAMIFEPDGDLEDEMVEGFVADCPTPEPLPDTAMPTASGGSAPVLIALIVALGALARRRAVA
jgi:hypothetical protein